MRSAKLTPTEARIWTLIEAGWSRFDIEGELTQSPNCLSVHCKNMRKKGYEIAQASPRPRASLPFDKIASLVGQVGYAIAAERLGVSHQALRQRMKRAASPLPGNP